MENLEFPYDEAAYVRWKAARGENEDSSKVAYIEWRKHRDLRSQSSSDQFKQMMEDSD